MDIGIALTVKDVLDRFVAPAVLLWFTMQWFRAKGKPAASTATRQDLTATQQELIATQQKARATSEGCVLGLILAATAGVIASPWILAGTPGAPPANWWNLGAVAVGLAVGYFSASARRLDNPIWLAVVVAVGTGGGIALIAAYYWVSESVPHQIFLCGIMALLLGLRLRRLEEVLK